LKALFDPSDNLCLKPILGRIFSSGNLENALKMALKSRVVFLPADLLNTFVMPPRYMPLVSTVAGFIWTVILAFSFAQG
jgi:hypothetical protein